MLVDDKGIFVIKLGFLNNKSPSRKMYHTDSKVDGLKRIVDPKGTVGLKRIPLTGVVYEGSSRST